MKEKFECIIIGAGPCGIGAALRLKELGIDFAIIEKGTIGGKVNIAPRVDNYPKHTKIPGPELAYVFYDRLIKAGINVIGDEVISLTKEENAFITKTTTSTYISNTVLIASGTKERKVGLDKEDYFLGRGLSYCALCDGHFFKGQDIVVIGGGNSALKEALYLTSICYSVTLIHRRNEFRGNKVLVDQLLSKPNCKIMTPFIPLSFIGDEFIEGIEIQNVETKEIIKFSCLGVFPLVGQIPQTGFIHIDGVKDSYGTIPFMKDHSTSCKGLFAGGDIMDRDIRQIFLAEHDGVVSANSINKYLKEDLR